VDLWWGLFAPAKTPADTLGQLADRFKRALKAPNVQAKFADLGFSSVGMCGSEFGALLRRQYHNYGEIIRAANIRAD
jgi:tripartite-type tricarboxylate transporter receptor subunit TctC